MFENLFIDRGAVAIYRAAPLLEERLSYLKHRGWGSAVHLAQNCRSSGQPASSSRFTRRRTGERGPGRGRGRAMVAARRAP